jgi:hypothetical protein
VGEGCGGAAWVHQHSQPLAAGSTGRAAGCLLDACTRRAVHCTAPGVHCTAAGVHCAAPGVHCTAPGVHRAAPGVHQCGEAPPGPHLLSALCVHCECGCVGPQLRCKAAQLGAVPCSHHHGGALLLHQPPAQRGAYAARGAEHDVHCGPGQGWCELRVVRARSAALAGARMCWWWRSSRCCLDVQRHVIITMASRTLDMLPVRKLSQCDWHVSKGQGTAGTTQPIVTGQT